MLEIRNSRSELSLSKNCGSQGRRRNSVSGIEAIIKQWSVPSYFCQIRQIPRHNIFFANRNQEILEYTIAMNCFQVRYCVYFCRHSRTLTLCPRPLKASIPPSLTMLATSEHIRVGTYWNQVSQVVRAGLGLHNWSSQSSKNTTHCKAAANILNFSQHHFEKPTYICSFFGNERNIQFGLKNHMQRFDKSR